ncbi:unnamed protein product, partial [Hymenolepis diminuta]
VFAADLHFTAQTQRLLVLFNPCSCSRGISIVLRRLQTIIKKNAQLHQKTVNSFQSSCCKWIEYLYVIK